MGYGIEGRLTTSTKKWPPGQRCDAARPWAVMTKCEAPHRSLQSAVPADAEAAAVLNKLRGTRQNVSARARLALTQPFRNKSELLQHIAFLDRSLFLPQNRLAVIELAMQMRIAL